MTLIERNRKKYIKKIMFIEIKKENINNLIKITFHIIETLDKFLISSCVSTIYLRFILVFDKSANRTIYSIFQENGLSFSRKSAAFSLSNFDFWSFFQNNDKRFKLDFLKLYKTLYIYIYEYVHKIPVNTIKNHFKLRTDKCIFI